MKRIIKYGIVGVSAFIVEYLSFLLLISATKSPYALTIAQSASFCLGLIVSFLGSRLFTFKNSKNIYTNSASKQFAAYSVLALINLSLSNVIIFLLVHYMLLAPLIAKICVMIMIVSWNFLIFNKLIFKSN